MINIKTTNCQYIKGQDENLMLVYVVLNLSVNQI